ncbi:MAG: hypothetical protein ACE14V_14155 [bacterium]
MKLKIREGCQDRYIEVKFWSFAKCHFLAGLAIGGIAYGIIIIIFAIVMLIMVLTTGHLPR